MIASRNIKLCFNDICFNLCYDIKNLLSLFLTYLDDIYVYYPLSQGLSCIVFCTGEGEGKGKRKASVEDDESANKRLVPEGGIAEVNTKSNKNLSLKKNSKK